MSRGLTDEPPVAKQDDNEIENVIRDIIIGQNKLHDRLVALERQFDHFTYLATMAQEDATSEIEAADRKSWNKGL